MPRIVCRSFPWVATILLAQESPAPIMSGNGRRGRLPARSGRLPLLPFQAPISRGHGKPPGPTYRLNPSRHGMTPRFQATGRTGTRRSVESPPAPTLPIESETQTRTSPSGVPSAKGTAILPLSTRESEMQFERGGDHVATPRRSTPINLGANPHDPGGFHPWASARR